MFSSRSFIISGLTFRSSNNFEFIFLYAVRECSHCFTFGFLVFPVPLAEETIFSLFYILASIDID